MRNNTCYLPNGQTVEVSPVFGGLRFKSTNLTLHHSVLPPGWTMNLYTLGDHPNPEQQQAASPEKEKGTSSPEISSNDKNDQERNDHEGADKHRRRRFTTPTLRNDCLYMAHTVDPSSEDFKPASSPTRQIALALWITLWWYFHEPEPDRYVDSESSAATPLAGKPKGEWRIAIKREGIFKKRNLLQKLERMGLIVCENTSVGLESYDSADPSTWENMFVSRQSFWQLDPRLFLFTLAPVGIPQSLPGSGGIGAREDTQVWTPGSLPGGGDGSSAGGDGGSGAGKKDDGAIGPFTSGSHLPTYFPPHPTQYTFTNGVRHPLRSKAPRQGEVVYTRYIPSVGQYLSFRVPYFSTASKESEQLSASASEGRPSNHSHSSSTSSHLGVVQPPAPDGPSDLEILHKWMNDPRVNAAWGEGGPISKQEGFLRNNLTARHSFPVFGCWDGKPFGYFEIYWVKEDRLGPLLGGVHNYDRGIHLLVGEQEFRGPHRLAIWLSSLVHFCWLSDLRTETVMLEPRVDNQKYVLPSFLPFPFPFFAMG